MLPGTAYGPGRLRQDRGHAGLQNLRLRRRDDADDVHPGGQAADAVLADVVGLHCAAGARGSHAPRFDKLLDEHVRVCDWFPCVVQQAAGNRRASRESHRDVRTGGLGELYGHRTGRHGIARFRSGHGVGAGGQRGEAEPTVAVRQNERDVGGGRGQ